MTTPFWCLFAAALIPYSLAPVSGYFRAKQFGSIDNKNPRQQQAESTDLYESLWLVASNSQDARQEEGDPDRRYRQLCQKR